MSCDHARAKFFPRGVNKLNEFKQLDLNPRTQEIKVLHLRYLRGAPAAKYKVGSSMNSLRNDKLKSWGLTSSKNTSYLQQVFLKQS